MTKLSKIIITAIVIVIAVFLTTLSDGSEKAEKSKVYVLIIAAVVCLWIQTRPTMKIEANKEITKKKIKIVEVLPWIASAILLILLTIAVIKSF